MPHKPFKAAIHEFVPDDGLHVLISYGPDRVPGSLFVTTRPHWYRNSFITVRTPKGFACDLTSFPWLIRWAIYWLYDPMGRHQRAAMFHDVLYRTQQCSRFTADAIYRVILEHDGVWWWRRIMLFYAVRLFGMFAWRASYATCHVDEKEMGDPPCD